MEHWKLRERLLEIARLARQEQSDPSGLHMTCLSIIEKNAMAALKEIEPEFDKLCAVVLGR
jgi:hypothetical protein